MVFSLLDLLFPKRCAGCGSFGNYVCEQCRKSQPLHFPQICPKCERPAVDGRTHPGCRTPLGLDGATFLFSYKPPISNLLKQLKYRFGQDLKDIIVPWTIEEFKKLVLVFPRLPTLIPIPLHPLRSNWRGFNQAALLGEAIAKGVGWEYDSDILVRTKFRKPQTEAKKEKQRRSNVRGVFSINPNAQCPVPNVLLFDDIWTTGATMKEAAKVLKRAGARFVWAFAITR